MSICPQMVWLVSRLHWSDGFIGAITGFAAFELINILADQVAFNPVAGDKAKLSCKIASLPSAPKALAKDQSCDIR